MSTLPIRAAVALAALVCAAPALAAEPPAKPAAAKPAAAKTAFDARDPAGLIGVLNGMGAKAEVAKNDAEGVFVNVTTPGYSFGLQFAGCDAGGKGCKGVAFSTAAGSKTATLPQINGFNQTSINCRAFQDPAGKAHISYSTLLFASDTAEDMRIHVGAWQGCVAAFGEFLSDPPGFLARAP
ncbi:hypothetical protein [Phenylobacterium sp.]|uniref:hypothetical protein n=1 Tax=Phenylobacterium sp. TaxID=1871053 RepID=UPI0035AE1A5A